MMRALLFLAACSSSAPAPPPSVSPRCHEIATWYARTFCDRDDHEFSSRAECFSRRYRRFVSQSCYSMRSRTEAHFIER